MMWLVTLLMVIILSMILYGVYLQLTGIMQRQNAKKDCKTKCNTCQPPMCACGCPKRCPLCQDQMTGSGCTRCSGRGSCPMC